MTTSQPNDVFTNPKEALTQRAILLSWLTIVYNLIEGMVSIGFGVTEESVALAGFGLDSLIEVASALIVLWRFHREIGLDRGYSLKKERRATFGIGILLILLALSTSLASLWQLWLRSHPQTTLPGLVIAAVSMSFMFFLWSSKQKLARQLNSSTVKEDANCSLACIKLSLVLWGGSLLFMSFPELWWADAGAAIIISVLIGSDGFQAAKSAYRADFTGGCGCCHEGRKTP